MENDVSVSWPVAKIMSLWAAIGVTTWTEFASFAAAAYSLLLIGEWFWKKFWRPIIVRNGWLKRWVKDGGQ